MNELKDDVSRRLTRQVLETCDALACHTEVAGEITRTYLSPPARQVHEHLREWATRLGMQTSVDAVGNLRSRLASKQPNAPTLYLGSHLDTVPNAGRYDGILGVVMAYATVEALRDAALPFAIEVLGLAEEEGVRYGLPFIGSRALTGTADPLLALLDGQGQSVSEAIRAYGLDPAELPQAAVAAERLGYFEIHIEQGPVLQDQNAALGVVEAIAGQNRVLLDFTGRASHAGTTPMNLRRDALAAAAHFAVEAETIARATPGLVATVGIMQAHPGAINVVPGSANCSLDIRHARDEVRREALQKLLAAAERFAAERHVELKVTPKMEEPAVPMDGKFRALLHRAAEELKLAHPELVSGAGHDAQIMGAAMPAAMLFVRSPNALSHHPDEMVNEDDVNAALRTSVRFLHLLAAEVNAGGHRGR